MLARHKSPICLVFMSDRVFGLSQGSVCARIGIQDENQGNPLVVVSSHDCDLVNHNESHLELIPAMRVDGADGNFSNAKNSRTLHLPYSDGGFDEAVFELDARAKFSLSWAEFNQTYELRPELNLKPLDKAVFRTWLASRYNRAAFPDSFNNRLRAKVGGKSILSGLQSLAKSHGEHVGALYLDLGDSRFIELPEATPYDLHIFVVYDHRRMLEGGEESSEAMAQGLLELFA